MTAFLVYIEVSLNLFTSLLSAELIFSLFELQWVFNRAFRIFFSFPLFSQQRSFAVKSLTGSFNSRERNFACKSSTKHIFAAVSTAAVL